MPVLQLDAECACDHVPQSPYGPVRNDERVIRVLTSKHYDGAKVLNSAFRVADIISEGISFTRLSMVDVVEFIAIAEDIRRLADASDVKGALSLEASEMRALRWDDTNSRKLCLFDDPVQDHDNERDNVAHCMAVSPCPIEHEDALEVRFELLRIFSEAKYLNDLWPIPERH